MSELLGDPGEEGALFRALLRDPTDDAARASYAAWLAAHDAPRTELLRLGALLGGGRGVEVESERRALLARFDELAQDQGEMWMQLMLPMPRVSNCGGQTSRSPYVRFSYECPQKWEGLRPTADPGVRYCKSCQQNVHRCDSLDKAAQHARRGECIAVESRLVAEVSDRYCRMMTGRPQPMASWAARALGDDDLPQAPKVPPPLPIPPGRTS